MDQNCPVRSTSMNLEIPNMDIVLMPNKGLEGSDHVQQNIFNTYTNNSYFSELHKSKENEYNRNLNIVFIIILGAPVVERSKPLV